MTDQQINETTRYLSFRLGREIFAVNVMQVIEVLDVCDISKVPQSPDFMKGIVNVRGNVIPVMDLRIKFGMPEAEHTADTRIIVMQLVVDGGLVLLGTLADAVDEVMELSPEQTEAAPSIGVNWRSEFIDGIGKQDDQFVIVLNMDRVFSGEEVGKTSATRGDAKRETASLMEGG